MSTDAPRPAPGQHPAPTPDGAGSRGPAGDPFEVAAPAWTRVSGRLVLARRIVLGVPALVVAAALVAGAVVDPAWEWVLVALVWLAAAVWLWVLTARQVRAIGYAERDDDLLVRRGVLLRTLVVVPYGRMQYVDVTAGPLDRALGIARVQLHTASASTDASIPGLGPAEATRLRDRLSQRGEARLAGL